MSLETHSKKRRRVYQRQFDHDEAVRLRGENWSYAAIGRQLGVSPNAVARVCNPVERARQAAHMKRYSATHRVPCKGDCGRTLYRHQANSRTGFCTECWARERTKDFVRPDELKCTKCGEWKPDEGFSGTKKGKSRRYRRSSCKRCDNKARSDYRQRGNHRVVEQSYDSQRKRKGIMARGFVVLKLEGEGVWRELGEFPGVSAIAAIETAASAYAEQVRRTGLNDSSNVYAALSPGAIFQIEPVTVYKATRTAS